MPASTLIGGLPATAAPRHSRSTISLRPMDQTFWKAVTKMIAGTRSTEIGCEDCFAKLDRFAELICEGKPADEIMPLVQDHLDRCDSCREEYEALLEALRETE